MKNTGTPRSYMLAVGLNHVDPEHYAGWDGRLNVCEADARAVAGIAKNLNFDKITLLLSVKARLRTVLHEIDVATRELKAGDIFIIYYSGHGGNDIPDQNKDEKAELADEIDNYDESWCLYDGQLIDDILLDRWHRFRAGVRIWVVSDSCFSGDIIKMRNGQLEKSSFDDAPLKRIPPQIGRKTYLQHKAFYKTFNAEALKPKGRRKIDLNVNTIKASVRLLSSSQEFQPSMAETRAFPENSLFTAVLMKSWNKGKFKGNYAQFVKKVKSQMPIEQMPNHFTIGKNNTLFDSQRPFTI